MEKKENKENKYIKYAEYIRDKNILTIDTSPTDTGWVIMNNGKIIEKGNIAVSTYDKPIYKNGEPVFYKTGKKKGIHKTKKEKKSDLMIVNDQIAVFTQILMKHKPYLVGFEELLFTSGIGRGYTKQLELNGALKQLFVRYFIKFTENDVLDPDKCLVSVNTSTIRAFILKDKVEYQYNKNNRVDWKKTALKYVNEIKKLDIKNHNIADAYLIGEYISKIIKGNLVS